MHRIVRWFVGVAVGIGVAGCSTTDANAVAPTTQEPSAQEPSTQTAVPAPLPSTPVTDDPVEHTLQATQTVDACASGERCYAKALAAQRAKHPSEAAHLYARACELGHGPACHRLGELHRDGEGTTPDDGQARAMFERGCQLGSSAACDALGH